ncbi:Protein of unknown function, partial [Gryllus bimaculatus]
GGQQQREEEERLKLERVEKIRQERELVEQKRLEHLQKVQERLQEKQNDFQERWPFKRQDMEEEERRKQERIEKVREHRKLIELKRQEHQQRLRERLDEHMNAFHKTGTRGRRTPKDGAGGENKRRTAARKTKTRRKAAAFGRSCYPGSSSSLKASETRKRCADWQQTSPKLQKLFENQPQPWNTVNGAYWNRWLHTGNGAVHRQLEKPKKIEKLEQQNEYKMKFYPRY